MTEDDIRDLFREMREDAVPVDSLAQVRLGLTNQIERRGRWKIATWAMAGAVVVLAALLFPWGAPIHRPAKNPAVVQIPSNPPLDMPAPAPHMTVRPAIQRTRRRRRPLSQAVTIRIETPDPEVVILLVGN
jgi:hypothetical protein